MAPFLVWLVLPERQRGSRLYECRARESRQWRFFHELLKQPHRDVVDSRLAAAKFPPWPNGIADDTTDDVVPEDKWAQWRAALSRARGRVVGAVILSAPEAAVNQLQLHSGEHRVWECGTLPSLKSRLATFKVLDVFALGNFMWPSGCEAANRGNDPRLHPVYSTQRATRSDSAGAAWDCVTDQCAQDQFFSNFECD